VLTPETWRPRSEFMINDLTERIGAAGPAVRSKFEYVNWSVFSPTPESQHSFHQGPARRTRVIGL
jgi:hypothetical protein